MCQAVYSWASPGDVNHSMRKTLQQPDGVVRDEERRPDVGLNQAIASLMDQARSVWGAQLKGTLKVEVWSIAKDQRREWACAAIDVEDADNELELAVGVGPSAAEAIARCSANLAPLHSRYERNARPRRDAEDQVYFILLAAINSDALLFEAKSPSSRRRSSRARAALRKAGDPEARISHDRIISGSLKATFQDPVQRLVEDRLAADSTWNWDDVPLDEQVRILREQFRTAGFAGRFRWDLRHDFPLV
jgi:hypothetical protein